MPKRTMLSVLAKTDPSNLRTAELFGETHTIIPAIALVEGVLWPANAPAPELALAEEFGRFPDSWNGRPVVFDHPRVNGLAVSAGHPEVMEEIALGQLFNTVVEDGKLKVEIWINEDRVKTMDEDVRDAVARLKEPDNVVEVSTGLFTMSEEAKGEFEGETFEAIWRNIVPDHLAILPEGVTGACSVEDGCGAPRTNKEFVPVMNAARLEFNTNECGCDAPKDNEEKKGMFQKIMESAGDMASHIFAFRDSKAHLSDSDTRTAIAAELSKSEEFFFIMAVFDDGDDTGTFVFESFMDGKLFQQSFSVSKSKVTLGEKKTEVRPVTQFVKVSEQHLDAEAETQDGSIQENQMNDKDQLVNGLIDNESTQFTADDRDWLSTLEESVLAKLSPVVKDVEEEEEAPADKSIGTVIGDTVNNEANEVVPQKPVTTEEYLKDAPEEIKVILNDSLRLHTNRKSAIVKALTENTRCTFSNDQLNAKSLPELEQMAALAGNDVTYEGQSPVVSRMNTSDDDAPPPALKLFDLDKTA